jgi:ABC-type multidrug transport system ATPase subunit
MGGVGSMAGAGMAGGSGMGGVGKTRLTLEYAWQHCSEYSARLYVKADSPSSLRQNLAELASTLEIATSENLEEQFRAVLKWLNKTARWLLILDNVDTMIAQKAVLQLLPQLTKGHVLITSRLTTWKGPTEQITLDVLSEPAAVEFLLDRTKGPEDPQRLRTPDDPSDAAVLSRLLGYLPQEFGIYPKISAYDMLDHIAILKGISSERRELVEELLKRVNLWDVRKKALGGFSGGMKQRFGIAQALIGDPKLIIVDEPTAGLDPGERNRFYNLLSEIGEQVIVILSTHIVEDVQELCPQMAIIDKGRVLYSGSPADALHGLQNRIWSCSVPRASVHEMTQQLPVISTRMVAGQPVLHVFSEQQPADGFSVTDADLEDVFFTYIKGHKPAGQA